MRGDDRTRQANGPPNRQTDSAPARPRAFFQERIPPFYSTGGANLIKIEKEQNKKQIKRHDTTRQIKAPAQKPSAGRARGTEEI